MSLLQYNVWEAQHFSWFLTADVNNKMCIKTCALIRRHQMKTRKHTITHSHYILSYKWYNHKEITYFWRNRLAKDKFVISTEDPFTQQNFQSDYQCFVAFPIFNTVILVPLNFANSFTLKEKNNALCFVQYFPSKNKQNLYCRHYRQLFWVCLQEYF